MPVRTHVNPGQKGLVKMFDGRIFFVVIPLPVEKDGVDTQANECAARKNAGESPCEDDSAAKLFNVSPNASLVR